MVACENLRVLVVGLFRSHLPHHPSNVERVNLSAYDNAPLAKNYKNGHVNQAGCYWLPGSVLYLQTSAFHVRSRFTARDWCRLVAVYSPVLLSVRDRVLNFRDYRSWETCATSDMRFCNNTRTAKRCGRWPSYKVNSCLKAIHFRVNWSSEDETYTCA